MARPRYEGKIYRLQFTLCLREGEDDDLISLLIDGDVEPGQRAQMVKTTMRQGIRPETAVNGEVSEEKALDMLFGLMQ